MKVIIAGTRNAVCMRDVVRAMEVYREKTKDSVTEVVSGHCKGADRLGEHWAQERRIPVKKYPPNWQDYGRGAGIIRNKEMADYADTLVALWDGQSKGTANMINEMELRGKFVLIHFVAIPL